MYYLNIDGMGLQYMKQGGNESKRGKKEMVSCIKAKYVIAMRYNVQVAKEEKNL